MSRAPSATTVVAGVIGDPIRHSRSPAILNAAFAAAGIDWTYVAFEVPAGMGAAAAEAVRVLGLGGMSVTMPHKQEVLAALDDLDPAARRLGAVNCIERTEGPLVGHNTDRVVGHNTDRLVGHNTDRLVGHNTDRLVGHNTDRLVGHNTDRLVGHNTDRLVGHNTDGAGYLSGLRMDGFDPRGARCVVLGAGGAARAVVLALHDAGAGSVAVVNRNSERAAEAAALAGDAGRVVASADLPAELLGTDLLVNATPVGMGDGEPSPVAPGILHEGLFVSDLIYHPNPTPLMSAAASVGARCAGGLGMLVGQAAEAFRIWTGLEPPLAEMAEAAAV